MTIMNHTGNVIFRIEKEEVPHAISTAEKNFIYKTFVPFSPDFTKGDRLHDILTSEETGEVKIKRYRVKNWDEMKTMIL